jgi:hypothetical protein
MLGQGAGSRFRLVAKCRSKLDMWFGRTNPVRPYSGVGANRRHRGCSAILTIPIIYTAVTYAAFGTLPCGSITSRWSFESRFWNGFDGDPAGTFVNDTSVSHGETFSLGECGHAAGRS